MGEMKDEQPVISRSVVKRVAAQRQKPRTDHRTQMDWEQVRLNGGPPCFYDDGLSGWYCGRAERWAGHGDTVHYHKFVPLEDLVAESTLARYRGAALNSAERELDAIRACDKCDLCEDHHD